MRVTELDMRRISQHQGYNSIIQFYRSRMLLVTIPQLVNRAELITMVYVYEIQDTSPARNTNSGTGDCIVHLFVQNNLITKLSLSTSQCQAEVQLHASTIVQLGLVLNRYESCYNLSHHTTTTRDPVKGSGHSRRLILYNADFSKT